MNITCIICKDLFEPSSDIFSTQCGHIFHYNCILPWLNKKKSCPQCREKASLDSKSVYSIHRIFFDINNEVSKYPEDTVKLQQRIESLEFELKLKRKQLDIVEQKTSEIEKQNVGLRSEIKKVEQESNKSNQTIFILREQLKDKKKISDENELLKRQVSHLKQTVEQINTIKELLHTSSETADEMIFKINDLEKVQTYATVLKRALQDATNKNRLARDKLKLLQKELSEMIRQRNQYAAECDKITKLQEELAVTENKKLALEQKVKELENANEHEGKNFTVSLNKKNNIIKPVKQRSRTSSDDNNDMCPSPKKLKNTISLCETVFDSDTSIVSLEKSTKSNKVSENEENSPYLRVKGGLTSLTTNFMKRKDTTSCDNFTLSKKTRLTYNPSVNSGPMVYDGFGGRSKEEILPSSPQFRLSKLKIKKPAYNAVKSKKAKYDDLHNNMKINNFMDKTDV